MKTQNQSCARSCLVFCLESCAENQHNGYTKASGDDIKTHSHAQVVCGNVPLPVSWPVMETVRFSAALEGHLFCAECATVIHERSCSPAAPHISATQLPPNIYLTQYHQLRRSCSSMIFWKNPFLLSSSAIFLNSMPLTFSSWKNVSVYCTAEINVGDFADSLAAIFILSAKDVLSLQNRKHTLVPR